MTTITLSNSQKRTAELLLVPRTQPAAIRRVVEIDGEPVRPESQPILARIDWARGRTPEEIANGLIERDDEIDFQSIGRPVNAMCRVYTDQTGTIQNQFRMLEVRTKANGEIREVKPYRVTEANSQHPIPYSGKFIKPEEAARKYVFLKVYQVLHQDGLTYDFMMSLCQEIEPKGMMLVRGGLAGNEPLVLQQGRVPAQGFLWGRTQGSKYNCQLLLTSQELKLPAQ